MMLTAPNLRVIHVTTHIGFIDAIDRLNPAWWNAQSREVTTS